MSYDAQESSDFSGQPVELYTFTREGAVWRFTSADENKIISLLLFEAVPIERPNYQQNRELAKGPITIKMAATVPFLTQFKSAPPSDVVQVTIQRYHEGDGELLTQWVGRVLNVKFQERTADVRCEPVYTSMRRPVLRRRYQTTCPHVLYGDQCGVASTSFSIIETLTSVVGGVLTGAAFDAFVDGYFKGGYVEWNTGVNTERRFIIDHVGSNLVINIPFLNMPNGSTVTAFAGCDHTLGTCNTKFSNDDNYGGQPFYPGKNPMNGTTIF